MNDQHPQLANRIELTCLFDTPKHHHKRKWGRLFEKPIPVIEKEFSNLVDTNQYFQRNIAENSFGWYDRDTGKLECMFSIIKNAMDLSAIGEVFELIKEFDPFFTYAIVHQKKDGEGCYDIFRFSRFSYLEHLNRVYALK
jgi:hypothetical protein